ncbi:MAG: methyltransferase domain-containing protein [Vicinamibacteria bacterium]|nr:methyltransferase domain-containing protein [Vicinamibacteria bacterium]
MTAAPTPDLFFQTLFAYQRTAALKTAIELDLFSAIHEGATTAPAIAERIGGSVRGTRILCDYMTILGFTTKAGDQYALTPDTSVFLVRQSPAYMGGTLEFLASEQIVRNLDGLTATVRRGTVPPQSDIVSEENPVWETFARAMVPMMAMPAQGIADILGGASSGPQRVLDIAAGHGIFGITVAQRNPQAEVVAVDWPRVLAVATENAEAMGVAARHSTIPGDAFTVAWGDGYDIALVTNFLHHFDVPTCTAFLRKVHASLNKGGRVVILEFVPNEDRVSPPFPAAFAMSMLAETGSGDAYTMAELTSMSEAAGFHDVARHDLEGPETVIVASA